MLPTILSDYPAVVILFNPRLWIPVGVLLYKLVPIPTRERSFYPAEHRPPSMHPHRICFWETSLR